MSPIEPNVAGAGEGAADLSFTILSKSPPFAAQAGQVLRILCPDADFIEKPESFGKWPDGERRRLEEKIGTARLDELLSLAKERDPELFWAGVHHLASREVRAERLETAQALFSWMAQGEPTVPAAARKKAQLEWEAMIGKGQAGRRMEFLAGRFFQQATDAKMIAPMILGSTVFQLTRTAVLGRLAAGTEAYWLTRGFGARATASLAGFAVEVPTFALGSRALLSASGEGVSWDGAAVGQDLLAATLTLGALKTFGYLGNQGFLKVQGLQGGSVGSLSRGQRLGRAVFSQGSMFVGLSAAHRLEESAGLRPRLDGATTTVDTLSTMVSLGVGASLGHRLLGPRFAAFQRELDLRSSQTGPLSSLFPIRGTEGIFTPGFAMAGTGSLPQGFAMAAGNPAGGSRPGPPLAMMMAGAVDAAGASAPGPLAGRYVVIGNRGEPAVRAVNEAKKLGAIPVVFYSEADAHSLHANMDGVVAIPLQGNTSNETYNNIPARMAGLEKFMKERSVAPELLLAWEGWGFKSEDSELFGLYEGRGIRAAGANSKIMAMMGNKISARSVAERAGVPVVPGSGKLQSYEEALDFARQAGFPVIIKGSDTGGGKGIRVALQESDLREAYESAKREALSTSGSDVVFVEKFIASMRHLEVQVIGDGRGTSQVLGVRDCTMQRNKQKVLEEDVTTFLDKELLAQATRIGEKIMAQLKADDARGVGYEGPGTIELIWDQAGNKLYFMEMNTRLQVEHTVTEMVSGHNLLREQLLIGSGRELSIETVQPRGHAIEARITSEDPYNKFTPSTGEILHLRLPETGKNGRTIVRVDSGIESGRRIPSFYDSMIAKLIVWAPTREEAVSGLQQALGEFEVLGVKTNIPFLRALTGTKEFRRGKGYDTNFIEKIFLDSEAGKPSYPHSDEALIGAAIHTYLKSPGIHQKVELKLGSRELEAEVFEIAPERFLVQSGENSIEVGLSRTSEHVLTLDLGGRKVRALIHGEPGKREVLIDGVSYEVGVGGEGALGAEYVVSPAPAAVLKVLKSVGDPVQEGDPVVITEAMKMETTLAASMSGIIEGVFIKPGQQVDKGKVLLKIQPEGDGKVGKSQGGAAASGFALPASAMQALARSRLPSEAEKLAALGWYTRYFEGFTAPDATLAAIVGKLEPAAESSPAYRPAVEGWLHGLLQRYQSVEAVFQPIYQRPLGSFLKTGKAEDPAFEAVLSNALRLHGVDSLEPSAARDRAVRRLFQSHEQLEGKRRLLKTMLKWVPRHEMNSVGEALNGVRRIFDEQSHGPFLIQVEETLARLRGKEGDREHLQALEEDFRLITERTRTVREKALKRISARNEFILPFLLSKLEAKSEKQAHWAMRLIQQRLYKDFYNIGVQRDYPSARSTVTRMTPKSGRKGPSLLVLTHRLKGTESLEAELDLAIRQFRKVHRKSANGSESVVELVLPNRLSPERLAEIEVAATRKLGGHGVRRLTLVMAEPEAGDAEYRTYEPDAAGAFRENALLRDIHPLHAETIGLSRWTENFDLERQDFGLFPNVHAYRAIQKGANPKDPRADRRHFVIGEHSGRMNYHRFEAEGVRNQLIQDYRMIRMGVPRERSAESRLMWQWLPFALRESGLIAKDFDPFGVGVLSSSPAEMVQQFKLDESKLAQAASVYDGKIYASPEAERLAADTALVMKRLQDSHRVGGEAKKLPAMADIFFRNPIEFSDEEIKLLAFRLTPQFMGQQLERTAIHFKRRSPHGGSESFVAEVRIPRGSRFEVSIRPETDAKAHAVKTPLEHKRAQQQGRGKLYAYDRVALFQDVIKEFYPQGNLPEEAVQIRELVLDPSGRLTPVLREPGKNGIAKLAFHVTLKLPSGTDRSTSSIREFAVIADDFTFQAGSQGSQEGEIYRALSRYAEEKGIPKLYLAETSGARLGLAEEVTPFVLRDDARGQNYVLAGDLAKPTGKSRKSLSELIVTGEPYEVEGETRHPILAIIGEGEINSESLNASGKTGESESRARSAVPTFTIAMGTVIGIGTYDARLSERVIMVEDSFLGLTGRKAINQTFGTNFKDELEVAGPEIMRENGVAYKVVPGEREALKAFLQWISYLPAKTGQEAPRFESADAVSRDITPALFGGENPVIRGRGQPYDTRRFDEALFDSDSVFYVREGYGRAANTGYARLGGRPVGLVTMQLQPEQIPGGDAVFGGALDAATSYKVAQHIENLDREGLPLVINASISGFMPRPEDHLKGVVPGGAKILDSLRIFGQPALIYVPPFGQLWGGAWVVIDKNINPNITMVADHSAAMGILGSAGAISVPKNERAMEADLHRHPELAALRAKIDAAAGAERAAMEKAYGQAAEALKTSHYLPKWRAILDAQNTAERAYRVSSIHEIIRDTAGTRAELHRLLESKSQALRRSREETSRARRERDQISGALTLMGIPHEWSPEGGVTISSNGVRLEIPSASLAKGLQDFFQGHTRAAFQSILEASLPGNPSGGSGSGAE